MTFRKRIVTALGILAAGVSFLACEEDTQLSNENCIQGEGAIVTQELELADFVEMNNIGTAHVSVSQGSTQKVVAIGHANIIEKVYTQVNQGAWNIGLDGNCFSNFELRFEVQVPNLEGLSITGTGNFTVGDFEGQQDLRLRISGTGSIELGLFAGCKFLEADLSGTGNVSCIKNWTGLEEEIIRVSGTGSFQAFPLVTERCEVTLSATGNGEVNVTQALEAVLSGTGSLRYKGDPSIVVTEVTGVGTVQQVD